MAKQKNKAAAMWLSVIGALLILIDGLVLIATKTFYGIWHYGGVSTVAWIEIILSLIIFLAIYLYKGHPKEMSWAIIILSLVTIPFDGGFYTLGAWLGLIGGILYLKE